MRTRLNLPFMLFSILISMMLWFVVFARDLPAPKPIRLKVTYPNLDQDKWYVDPERSPGRVVLKFFGPSDSLQEVEDRGPTVDVDISNPREGTYRYPAELNPNTYQKLLSNQVIRVPITLEKVLQSTVPVEVKRKGLLSDPNLKVVMRVSPPKVVVSGPRSIVDKVTHCRAWIDLSQVDPLNPDTQFVTLTALDDSDTPYRQVRIVPVQVAITPSLTAQPAEKLALVVPQIVGQPAAGFLPAPYRYEPTSIEVTGDPEDLARLTVIPTEPIDVNGLTADKVFRVRLRVPPKLKLKDRGVITILYRVRPDPSYHPGKGPSRKPPADNGFPSTVPPLNGAKGGGP